MCREGRLAFYSLVQSELRAPNLRTLRPEVLAEARLRKEQKTNRNEPNRNAGIQGVVKILACPPLLSDAFTTQFRLPENSHQNLRPARPACPTGRKCSVLAAGLPDWGAIQIGEVPSAPRNRQVHKCDFGVCSFWPYL